MMNNAIFNNNIFFFHLFYKLQFSSIIGDDIGRLRQLKQTAFDCGSFHIYKFLVEEERQLTSQNVKLVNEQIDVSSLVKGQDKGQSDSASEEPFLHKLRIANSKFKLSSIWNMIWTGLVILGIFFECRQQFYPIAVISAIVLVLATLPGLIFWNRCEVKNLLKKKRQVKARSLEMDDSLNESREFRENNDFGMLTLDVPSSSVKTKNFKLASIYNLGKHYIDYNKQRCRSPR